MKAKLIVGIRELLPSITPKQLAELISAIQNA